MTEATRPLPVPPEAPVGGATSTSEATPTPGINVTRLLAEAAGKAGVLWIRVPEGTTHPAWYVWHDDGDPRGTGPAAYVISGVGEQSLPWLPEQVEVILRSKDNGGRLLTIGAAVREITPASPEWDAAVAVVRPGRLNLVGTSEEVEARWRAGCTVHVLTPVGRPVEQPGAYAAQTGSRVVTPAAGTTVGKGPWHWRGRPASRRGTVRPVP